MTPERPHLGGEVVPESATRLKPDELRSLLMDLLAYVDEFCRRRDITYCLYAGTLIGAVRHGGFIPWDDDADIMMSRDDYARFCREFPRDGLVRLVTSDTHATYPYPYAKVSLTGTLVSEQVVMAPQDRFGVNIDVFPFDGASRNRVLWWAHALTARLVRVVLLLKVVRPRSDMSAPMRVALKISQLLLAAFPARILVRARTKLATLWKPGETMWAAMLVVGRPWRVPVSWISPSIHMPFEGESFSVPSNSHGLLTVCYGDYMTPPPPEHRVPPHQSIAYALSNVTPEDLAASAGSSKVDLLRAAVRREMRKT